MEKIIDLLLNTQQANLVMKNIANYIIYLYPGVISIYSYNFFNAKKTMNSQAFVLKSFAISYLYIIFVDNILLKINKNIGEISYNCLIIAISIIIPYIIYSIINSKCFFHFCQFWKISTMTTNVPFELIEDEDEDHICVKVYLNDNIFVYIGYLSKYEYEEESKNFVILTGYKKYVIDEKSKEKLLVNNDEKQYKEKVYIKLDDIKIIEKIAEERAKKEIYS